MMRRCILEFSTRRSSLQRVSKQAVTQTPYFHSARKEFSGKSANQNVPNKPFIPTEKPPESGSNATKVVVGGIAVGAVIAGAYQSGYLSRGSVKEEKLPIEISKRDSEDLRVQVIPRDNQEAAIVSPDVDNVVKSEEAQSEVADIHDPSKSEGEIQVPEGSNVVPEEDTIPTKQKDYPVSSQDNVESDGQANGSEVSTGSGLGKQEMEKPLVDMENGKTEGPHGTLVSPETETKVNSEETKSEATLSHLAGDDRPKDSAVNGEEPSSSLLDAYSLQKDEGSPKIASKEDTSVSTDGSTLSSEKREALGGMGEESKDAYITKDGKVVLDFLQAIHAAEKEQAELDARIFFEEKRMLKEKYEKELKDARARQLMYAEEAAILDKELNKERARTAATIKSLQEIAEQNLKIELERKEKEAKLQLEKAEALAKAEIAAAIASEKASQIEKLADANLNINALCMAFYARSEEARQSHSVHKLALGALALEDALSKGLPIQSEIKALHSYLEGIDKDSLLNLVLSSLPEETLKRGTDTQLQLNQKFDSLKGTLRHYSLLPPGGGGILAHTVAHIASGLKVKEDDQSGDGIESVINRVEGLLLEGKLAEAADALEGGVSGSQAEEIIGDWVKRARNRAITEQALSMLQSYATSISVT